MAGPVGTKTASDKKGAQVPESARSMARPQGRHGLHGDLLTLQRAAGNQAVSHLVQPIVNRAAQATDHLPPIVSEVLGSGGGQPIEPEIRSFLEERFGEDFSGVRIHTDEAASASAQELDAAAYTAGQDIVFGGGRYTPSTTVGMHRLAHELAHVTQQRNSKVPASTCVSNPTDYFERTAESAASLVSGIGSTAASCGLGVGQMLGSANQATPAVQRQALTASPTAQELPTKHRRAIPPELKVEMVRQIREILSRWHERLLPLKGSDIDLVVSLVWEYAQRGRDAGAGSDWVDTFISLMTTTVYNRGKVIASWTNLWDDALQNASPLQRQHINKYLSQVGSQYATYKPPDISAEPSFWREVAGPVGWKALELFSLGLVDEKLFQVSAEAAKQGLGNQLLEVGKLLAMRVAGILTFGGAPSAYDKVKEYLEAHPNDDLATAIWMGIAKGGEGFATGLEETILPVKETKTLASGDATVWQKMEAFFSALLKVVTLGEMAKRGGGPREGAPKGEPAAGRPAPAREPSRTETVAPELKEPAKPVTPPEPEVTSPPAKPEPPAAKVREPTAAPAPSEKVAPPRSSPSSTRPRPTLGARVRGVVAAHLIGIKRTAREVTPGHGSSPSAIVSERPATATLEPSPTVRPEAPAVTPGPERPHPTPATPAAAESSPQNPTAGPAQAPTPATAPAAEPPAPAPGTATAPPEEIVKATAAISLEEQLQSVENEIDSIGSHPDAPVLRVKLESIRGWVKRNRPYEARQLLKNLSDRVETAKLSSEAGALEPAYESTEQHPGSPAEPLGPEELRERERLPGEPKSQGKLWTEVRKGKILNLTGFENPLGERLRIPPKFKPFGKNGPSYRQPQISPERLRSLREEFGDEGPTNRQLAERGNSCYLPNGDRVDLHHRNQDPFAPLDEHSKSFHESVEEDPDFHPEAGDPGYESWRGYKAFFEGRIRTLGDIYDILRRRYWQNRFE